MAHYANRPFKSLTMAVAPTVAHILDGRFPKSGRPSFREVFGLKRSDTFYAFENPDVSVKKSVLYFPGCGSERMFTDIAFASIAMLYQKGIRVVVPPDYLCCGYPLKANGKKEQAEQKTYENSVIFHRMAETVSYMNIRDILVSCGTCHEMLCSYRLEDIFWDSTIVDVNEFLVRENLVDVAQQKGPRVRARSGT